MKRDGDLAIISACKNHLDAVLSEREYCRTSSYIRPRGVAVEYNGDGDFIFVVSEGGAVGVDIIFQRVDGEFWRADVNYYLWTIKNRDLVAVASTDERIQMFAATISQHSVSHWIFEKLKETPDPRYCFAMSTSSKIGYLQNQRGCSTG